MSSVSPLARCSVTGATLAVFGVLSLSPALAGTLPAPGPSVASLTGLPLPPPGVPSAVTGLISSVPVGLPTVPGLPTPAGLPTPPPLPVPVPTPTGLPVPGGAGVPVPTPAPTGGPVGLPAPGQPLPTGPDTSTASRQGATPLQAPAADPAAANPDLLGQTAAVPPAAPAAGDLLPSLADLATLAGEGAPPAVTPEAPQVVGARPAAAPALVASRPTSLPVFLVTVAGGLLGLAGLGHLRAQQLSRRGGA